MDSNFLLDSNSPKYSATKNIIDTASKAFFTYGIKSITMDEIASSAGISKRTLYQLFKDKEELLLGTIINSQIEMARFTEELLKETDDVLEIILKTYNYIVRKYQSTDKRFFEDLTRYPEAYKILAQGQKRDISQSVAFFKKGVTQGIFRDDVNYELFCEIMREQFHVFISSSIFSRYSFLEVHRNIIFIHLRGISTEKGAQELENFIKENKNEKF